ncbi:MAG: DUF4158 domain-containing protein [Pseudomonadota bacterium]|nr:DUF4158 domain-containing protein [Pseudomonadota bacterium]
MLVSFISEAQLRRYGRFSGKPTPEQLSRFFHLDDRDRELIELKVLLPRCAPRKCEARGA